MKQKRILLVTAAVAAVIAASTMVIAHRDATTVKPMHAGIGSPDIADDGIAHAIHNANVRIENLSVHNVGGIVILRGAAESEAADRAVTAVKSLGFSRVANLIQPTVYDDENIRREAERQLAQVRALDGCVLKVNVTHGVVSVIGTVQSELQADAARQVLKRVNGVQDIKLELTAANRASS
jgi:osmotically-inducible protein OsmY